MSYHLGYAKHDYQGKTSQDDLLSDTSEEDTNTQSPTNSSSGQDDNPTMPKPKSVGKPKKSNARNGTTSKTVHTDFGELRP